MHFCSDCLRWVVAHMSQCAVNVEIWLTFLSQKIKIPKKNKISACVGKVGRSDFCCIRISCCKTKRLVLALPYIAEKSDWGYSPFIKLNHRKNVMSAFVILPFLSSVSLKSLMDSATFLLSVNSSNVPFPRNGHHEIFFFTTNSNLSRTKLQNWKNLIRFIWMMTVDTSFHIYCSERHQNALAFHTVTKFRGWV